MSPSLIRALTAISAGVAAVVAVMIAELITTPDRPAWWAGIFTVAFLLELGVGAITAAVERHVRKGKP